MEIVPASRAIEIVSDDIHFLLFLAVAEKGTVTFGQMLDGLIRGLFVQKAVEEVVFDLAAPDGLGGGLIGDPGGFIGVDGEGFILGKIKFLMKKLFEPGRRCRKGAPYNG